MLKRTDIINLLNQTDFNPSEYYLSFGAALVMYGVRAETDDIDMGCSKELADRLESEGYKTVLMENGKRNIKYSEKIDIYEDWSEGEIVIIDNIPVLSIQGVLAMKKRFNREKDKRDIALIEEYLRNQK